MKLKEKLQLNSLTIGSWVTIGHPAVVEIMASAGFEWLTIDMEHSAIGFETAQNLITAMQLHGVTPLVRVGRNDDLIIKRVMDIGAAGVIVPMVNSVEDAQRAVANVKYPPDGARGVGLYRAQNYGTSFNEYKKFVKKDSIVIAQIEHIDAVDNIDGILYTHGIDGIIIGPYDLSASMGMPGEYDKPEVQKAIGKVEEACKRIGKPLGFHVIQSDSAKLREKIDSGYTFLAFSLDFFFLGDKAREEMGKVGY